MRTTYHDAGRDDAVGRSQLRACQLSTSDIGRCDGVNKSVRWLLDGEAFTERLSCSSWSLGSCQQARLRSSITSIAAGCDPFQSTIALVQQRQLLDRPFSCSGCVQSAMTVESQRPAVE